MKIDPQTNEIVERIPIETLVYRMVLHDGRIWITDLDAGVEAGSAVSQEEVFATFAENLERLRGLLSDTIAALPDPDGCPCETWADGIDLTYDIPS